MPPCPRCTQGPGDTVVAVPLPGAAPGEVVIQRITGEGGRLSLDPAKNCVGVAATATLRALGTPVSCGVGLTLHKGLPLGSGLGSSAASAAAAAAAVNGLFGSPLSAAALVPAGLESEAAVSGYHADNIAPALLGGFVLIRSARGVSGGRGRLPLRFRSPLTGGLFPRSGQQKASAPDSNTPLSTPHLPECRSCEPLDLESLAFPGDDLWFVLVNPLFEAPTAAMRAALRKEVPMGELTRNCAAGASLVSGILRGDVRQVGASLNSDVVVEPVRGPLIPGFPAVKEAACAAGASVA